MKNFYTLFLLILLPLAGFSQLTTPDENTAYTLEDLTQLNDSVVTFTDGTYYINYPLVISLTDTLEVNDDVTVLIAQDALVTIKGGFFVNSNSLFSKIDTTYKGFKFESESVVNLQGATFEYGGGFKATSGNLVVKDCIIRYQTKKTGTSGAFSLSTGKPYFENCTFLENERCAIGGPANGSIAPSIINCTLIGNSTLNENRPQINLGPSGADTIYIVNNIVTGYPEHDKVGGIAVASIFGTLSNAVISGNVVTNNRYGMTAMGNSLYTRIVSNIFEDNNTEGDPMLGGSGINILSTGENGHVILDNEMRGNLWGITIQGNGMVNMGDLSDEEVGSGNNFFSNNGNSGFPFALYNNTPNDVKAQGNCWIEEIPNPTEEEVEDVIFHFADVDSLGTVDYSFFTCGMDSVPCDAPADLVAEDITFNSAQISWSALEIAPANGYEYFYATDDQVPAGAGINTIETTVVLNDLLPNTTYYFWVRSDCGDGYSYWAGPESFTTDETSGVSELSLNQIAKLYPNPSNGTLNIDLSINTAETIAILDLSGRVLEQIKPNQTDHIKLDLSRYAAGVYVVQISGSDFISTGKFLIQ